VDTNDQYVQEQNTMDIRNIRSRQEYGPVKSVIDKFVVDLVAGRIANCPHVRNPQLMIVRMAVPDCMYCRSCAEAELLPHLGERAEACDACGRSSAALTLTGTSVNLGSVIMVGNVCNDCNSPSQSGWAS
jgi:hypothetical protein